MNQLKTMCRREGVSDSDNSSAWRMGFLQLKKMIGIDTVTIAGMGGSLIAINFRKWERTTSTCQTNYCTTEYSCKGDS